MSYQATLEMIESKINHIVELVENEKDQASSLEKRIESDIRPLLKQLDEQGTVEAFSVTSVNYEDIVTGYKLLINFPDAEETSDIDIAIDRKHGPFWLGGSRHYSGKKKRSL